MIPKLRIPLTDELWLCSLHLQFGWISKNGLDPVNINSAAFNEGMKLAMERGYITDMADLESSRSAISVIYRLSEKALIMRKLLQ